MSFKRRFKRRLPNYLPMLEEAADHAGVPGEIHVLEVRHDWWCDLLAGRGDCNCHPDIVSGPSIDKRHGL